MRATRLQQPTGWPSDANIDREISDQHRLEFAISHEVGSVFMPPRMADLRSANIMVIADLLDGLTAGLFLVDAAARILHVNTSGRAMLTSGAILLNSAGRLAPAKTAARGMFKRLLCIAAAGRVDGANPGCVALTSDEGECWLAHVLPLARVRSRQDNDGSAAVAAVLVRKAALGRPAPETLAKLYQLTPAELRILLAIVEVGRVPDIAAVLKVSETTVKTHLRRLFSKTNTSRQADLVKLVACFANPLGG